MKKKVFGRYFSRSRKAREALFKSLMKALILHGKINTTLAKAKAIQPDVEKLVTLAKKDSTSKEREVASFLRADRALTEKLTKQIVPSFKERKGGFTRIIKLPVRKGDSAEMARIEWTDQIAINEQPKFKKETKTETKTKKIAQKPKRGTTKRTKSPAKK